MVYLHVPFCRSFCTYCGFYSEICSSYDEYAEAVLREIEQRREEIEGAASVNTLYIGGGTPSVLPLSVLRRIVAKLAPSHLKGRLRGVPSRLPQSLCSEQSIHSERSIYYGQSIHYGSQVGTTTEALSSGGEGCGEPSAPRAPSRPACGKPPIHEAMGGHRLVAPLPAGGKDTADVQSTAGWAAWEEFTIEVNPEDIVEQGDDYVKGLLGLGVTRFSMGIQSFDDGILKWMNRRHDAQRAVEAFRTLRRNGADNISIDLISGLSQLTDETWQRTIDKALELDPEHISAYQLSIEDDSAVAAMLADGRYEEADEDLCRRQYDTLCKRLEEAGYRHYEISNFAKPGREAIHNSAYWRRVPYVGLGPGAHSLEAGSTGRRSWNSRELPRKQKDGTLTTYSRTFENLTPEDIRIERIMLPLRTDVGIPEKELYSLTDKGTVDQMIAEGALTRPGNGMIRIPEDHFFTSDEIICELI